MDSRLQSIRSQFHKMELQKQDIIHLLRSIPPEKYSQHPDPNTWSMGQVAHHLYLSEKNSLAYLKKKLSYPDSVPKYHPISWGGILLVKLVFLTRFKIKAPDSLDMRKFSQPMPLDELDTKWNELHREFLSFLEMHLPAFGKHLVFRHPFAGRMTMYQMLIFINDHIRHHQHQITRIWKQLP